MLVLNQTESFNQVHISMDINMIDKWIKQTKEYFSQTFSLKQIEEIFYRKIYLNLIQFEQIKAFVTSKNKLFNLLYDVIYNNIYFLLTKNKNKEYIEQFNQEISQILLNPFHSKFNPNILEDQEKLNQVLMGHCVFCWGQPQFQQCEQKQGLDLMNPNQFLQLVVEFYKDYKKCHKNLHVNIYLYWQQQVKAQQFSNTMRFFKKYVLPNHKFGTKELEDIFYCQIMRAVITGKSSIKSITGKIYNNQMKPVFQEYHCSQILTKNIEICSSLWKVFFMSCSEIEKDQILVNAVHKNYPLGTFLLIARNLRNLQEWERSCIIFCYLLTFKQEAKFYNKYQLYLNYQIAKLLFKLAMISNGLRYLNKTILLFIEYNKQKLRYFNNKENFYFKICLKQAVYSLYIGNKKLLQESIDALAQIQLFRQQNQSDQLEAQFVKVLVSQKKIMNLKDNPQQLALILQIIQKSHYNRQDNCVIGDKLYLVTNQLGLKDIFTSEENDSIFIKLGGLFSSTIKNRSSIKKKSIIKSQIQFDDQKILQQSRRVEQLLIFNFLCNNFHQKNLETYQNETLQYLENVDSNNYTFLVQLYGNQNDTYLQQFSLNQILNQANVLFYLSYYENSKYLLNILLKEKINDEMRKEVFRIVGEIEELSGDYVNAIVHYQYSRRDARLDFNIANIYRILCENDKAREFYRYALEKSINYREACLHFIMKMTKSNNLSTIITSNYKSINSIYEKERVYSNQASSNMTTRICDTPFQSFIDTDQVREDLGILLLKVEKELSERFPQLLMTVNKLIQATRQFTLDCKELKKYIFQKNNYHYIACGGQSKVYKVKDFLMKGKYYACKESQFSYNESDVTLEEVERFRDSLNEIFILAKVKNNQCQGLIELIELGFDQRVAYKEQVIVAWAILPYYENGTLNKFIRQEERSRSYWIEFCYRLLWGLKQLMDMKIVHLDLKPDNILIDENFWPVISDFGISQNQFYSHEVNISATYRYCPPEFITSSLVSMNGDMYSFGSILYFIFARKEPWSMFNCYQCLSKVEKEFHVEHKADIDQIEPEFIRQMIIRCTENDKTKRMNVYQGLEYYKMNMN